MSLVEYREDENTPEHQEPTLDEVLMAVDSADTRLCMAYSRYLEKPTEKRMGEITQGADELFGAFGSLMRKVTQGSTRPLPQNEPQEEMGAILATVLHGITEGHSELLADYTDDIVLASEQDKRDSLLGLTEILQDDAEESNEALIDAALARLRGVIDSDIEVIEIVTAKKLWFKRQLGKKSLTYAGNIVQIGTGSALGILIAERISQR